MSNCLYIHAAVFSQSYFVGRSDGKFDYALALFDGDVVSVQEVAVEACLEAARQDLGQAVLAVQFVSVDPVQDVEESVHAQGSHVVGGYVLNNSYLVQHHNLRNECKCLEPETEAPLELEPPLVVRQRVVLCCVGCVADQGQHKGSWHQGLEVWEVIAELVIGLKGRKEFVRSYWVQER